jgi:ABC-type sugar transport system permease subunit
MMNTPKTQSSLGLFQTKRGRVILENLTAYAFLAPAGLLILLFGLLPVAFAFFVSLHKWKLFPDEYVGLANYEKSLGNFGYILFFWLAIGAFISSIILIRRLVRLLRESGNRRDVIHVISGIAWGYTALLAIDWIGKLVPVIMNIPREVRGQNTSLDLFMQKLGESFQSLDVLQAGNLMLVGLIVTLGLTVGLLVVFRSRNTSKVIVLMGGAVMLLIGAYFIMA